MIKLKDMLNEKTVADKDKELAQDLKIPLGVILRQIDLHMAKIDKTLSSFNSPGLKHAFIDAIRVGVKRQGKFDLKSAKKHLDKYFSR